jgi:hypothetical protein
MYEQLVQAQRRSAQKLSDANARAQRVERELASAQRGLAQAERALAVLASDLRGAARASRGLEASARLGIAGQPLMASAASTPPSLSSPLATEALALSRRLAALAAGAAARRLAASQAVARAVPLEWIGIASEVRVMGDFDGWTAGVALNPADGEDSAGGGGSTFCRFEGELRLRPGQYQVKLLVDGEWRLCGGWPEADDGSGNTVNVLTVVAVGSEEEEEVEREAAGAVAPGEDGGAPV